jgi:AGZA family xanthine/uracil permease-like MFS transporter
MGTMVGIIAGYFVMTFVKDIDWGEPGVGIPCLLTIGLMPFTCSIRNGVGAGFLFYRVIRVIAVRRGKARRPPAPVRRVAVFAWYFAKGLIA